MTKSFKTKGKVFIWTASNGVGWYFAYIDKDTSDKIQSSLKSAKVPRVAFGSVRVEADIGASTWRTSLFPSSKDKVYMLPIKAPIRNDEDVYEGDVLDIALTLM